MTKAEATKTARSDYVSAGRQWTVDSLIGCLPQGYTLTNIEDGDLHPPTVERIAHIVRRHAVEC